MSLRFRFFTWAIVLSAAASGLGSVHAEIPRLFSGAISWVLRPSPIPVDGSTSRTSLGGFLFQQPLRPDGEAVLAPGQSGVLPGILGKKTPVMLDGQRFMAVTGGMQNTPYCSLASITNKGQRLCFIDSNEDGRFDYQIRAFGLPAPFERMLPANIVPGDISYTLKSAVPDPLMYAGLLVRSRGSKGYAIEFAVSEKGKSAILDSVTEGRNLRMRSVNVVGSKFTAEQLPFKVGLYGAVVEIVAISGKDVTYRLLSGFDPDHPIIIARAGSLPVLR